jgi:hypothetical protein
VCFRREGLVGATPFPTVRFGAEELTFNFELTRAGGTFFFDPSIVIAHLNRTTLRAYLAHQHVLGVGSAMARRLVPLPGAVATRHPVLIPLLPLLRRPRVLGRVAGAIRASCRNDRADPIALGRRGLGRRLLEARDRSSTV